MNIYVRSVTQGAAIGLLVSAMGRFVTDPLMFGIGVAVISALVLVVSLRFFPERQ
jgi:hypothetical protein